MGSFWQYRNFVISPQEAYAIKVKKDCRLPIGGNIISDEEARKISLKQGWNAIGYTPVINLPVETAMSDYFDHAETGDVIKSHTEFAYFTKVGNSGRWRGSLQYMKPGEGYMLLHKSPQRASFIYPFYEMNSIYSEDSSTSNTSRSAVRSLSRSTMNVCAVVEGFEPEDGDVLVAYANGEQVGVATLSSAGDDEDVPVSYLNIAGDGQTPIWFAIEREGDIVASTGTLMSFKTNAVIGSPDQPTSINFARAEKKDGQWYTINGILLQTRPTQKGLYIYNGRKVVVK